MRDGHKEVFHVEPHAQAGGTAGRAHRVYQPFWGYHGAEDLEWSLRESGCNTFYVAAPRQRTTVAPENSERILRDASALRGWEEVPAAEDLLGLGIVEVRKYVKR